MSIKLPVKLKKPGQVQWDGRYIGVQDMLSHVIYRLRVVKFTATVVGTVQLTTSLKEQPAWIQGNRVIVPYRKIVEQRLSLECGAIPLAVPHCRRSTVSAVARPPSKAQQSVLQVLTSQFPLLPKEIDPGDVLQNRFETLAEGEALRWRPSSCADNITK